VLGFSERLHTGHKRLPQRPIIGPFRKDFVDGRIVDRRCPIGGCRHRQALPLHPCVEEAHDEVQDAVIAQFALGTTLGHREVRQEKCLECRCRELDRKRCRCRRWSRGAPQAMASWEEEGCALGQQITSETTSG